MGLAEDIKRGLGAVLQGKAYQVIPTGLQGRPQYPNVDIESLFDTYARNELVFAAIGIKAAASIGVRLLVDKRSSPKADWQEEPGHPFRQLMMAPNPDMLESDLLRSKIVGHDVAGLFYAEKQYQGTPGRGGIPIGLHPLNPACIAPIPRADGKADYQYKEGSHTEIIPYERMLVSRMYDPRSKLQGLSPLSVAMGSVDADNAQTDYIRAFFNNAGVPSGILKINGTVTQEKADELRLKWRARLGRVLGRQHDITVLGDNAEYQKVGANLNELASREIRMFTETRIAMVFSVPGLIIYDYAGLEKATYANLQEAWKGFWSSYLKPMYWQWSEFLTHRLLVDFEGPDRIKAELVRLRWDFSGVEWLKESENEAHARAREDLKAGGITLNEYRQAIGQQPDPGGDYYIRSFSSIAVPKGTMPDQPADATTTDAAKARAAKAAAYATKKAAGRKVIEQRIRKDMAATLAIHYKKVADAVRAAA